MGYNLLWRSVEYDVQPICKERGISILAYSPLQQGLLSGRFNSIDDIPVGRRRGKLFADVGDSPARHGLPGCEKEVFEAVNRIKAICARENINMAQASIAWLLQQDAVPVVIVGAKNPEQVVANSKIIKLSDSVVKELSDATEEVKAKLGRALDQWVHPDRCE
ncbi:uncharacterized oxidoreductase YccK [Patella vulgata]|uniref:uncharacterized oxidoreductase YccK n=1 Tax=Patella vulgata TaxID=6465 RepID=UPI002180037A|nr:uncharacterized oxidoreductase YccK [Patella vulgata]